MKFRKTLSFHPLLCELAVLCLPGGAILPACVYIVRWSPLPQLTEPVLLWEYWKACTAGSLSSKTVKLLTNPSLTQPAAVQLHFCYFMSFRLKKKNSLNFLLVWQNNDRVNCRDQVFLLLLFCEMFLAADLIETRRLSLSWAIVVIYFFFLCRKKWLLCDCWSDVVWGLPRHFNIKGKGRQ